MSAKISEHPTYTIDDQHEMIVVDNIASIEGLWGRVAPQDNVFLQVPYLSLLEKHPPLKLGFRYIVFYKDKTPIGLAYVQTYDVKMIENVQSQDIPEGLWDKIKFYIQRFFIKKAVFNVLICGNLLLTGEHGYYFNPLEATDVEAAYLVQKGIDLLQRIEEKQQGKKVHIQMFKDYVTTGQSQAIDLQLKNEGAYHCYTIQPSMYIAIPKTWNSFDDYLDSMLSKYRVRARRAAKKGEELTKKELSLSEIEENNDLIYGLYKGIADNVGFNAFTLHEKYFLALKKYLGDNFKLVAYYLDGKMVAFYTGIFNGEELEAHFLGVDHEFNHSHQVYLNILYDLIQMGIYHKMKVIDFARTALEIKSSVGAVPCEMKCYLRHRSRLSNNLMKFIFENLSPDESWEPRHPFKDMDLVRLPEHKKGA